MQRFMFTSTRKNHCKAKTKHEQSPSKLFRDNYFGNKSDKFHFLGLINRKSGFLSKHNFLLNIVKSRRRVYPLWPTTNPKTILAWNA